MVSNHLGDKERAGGEMSFNLTIEDIQEIFELGILSGEAKAAACGHGYGFDPHRGLLDYVARLLEESDESAMA